MHPECNSAMIRKNLGKIRGNPGGNWEHPGKIRQKSGEGVKKVTEEQEQSLANLSRVILTPGSP